MNNELTYEDLAAPTDETEARLEYNRIYVNDGLSHLCSFDWYYTMIWPYRKGNL